MPPTKKKKTTTAKKQNVRVTVRDLSPNAIFNNYAPRYGNSVNDPTDVRLESNSIPSFGWFNPAEIRLNKTDHGYGSSYFNQIPYNADLEPFQHPLLRKCVRLDPDDTLIREALFESSPYLRTQTFDIIFKLFDVGWRYQPRNSEQNTSEETSIGRRRKPEDELRELEEKQRKHKEQQIESLDENAVKDNLTPRMDLRDDPNSIEKIGDSEQPFDEKINTTSDSGIKIPRWSDDLKIAVIRSLSRAMVVGSDFICRIRENDRSEPIYQTFSVNDIHRAYYTEFRRIEEVYFNIKQFNDGKCQTRDPITKGSFKMGFLTQFATDKSKPSTFADINIKNGEDVKQIHRNCVVITPLFDMNEPFGKSCMYNEIITAIQKLYLRFYEMLYMFKGGVDRNIVAPQSDEDVMNPMLRSFQRGIQGLGFYLEVDSKDSDLNAKNVVQFNNTPMPNLPFSEIESHLNADAVLTQQGISGSAEGNNMSATASVVNDINDTEVIQTFQLYLHKAIKDVNEVFFDVDPETYDIVFNRIPTDLIDRMQTRQQIYEKDKKLREATERERKVSKDGEQIEPDDRYEDERYYGEQNSAGGYYAPPFYDPMAALINAYNYAEQFSQSENMNKRDDVEFRHEITVEQNSISDEYVMYKGNMFQAGVYKYPERNYNQHVTLTPEDIKRYCEKDEAGRTGYIEIDHLSNAFDTRLNEGIGYAKTIGYDAENRTDITEFYVRLDAWNKLGRPPKIDVSPRYVRKALVGGGNDIGFIDCALILNTTPRTKLSGLKSEAFLEKTPKK